MFILADHRAFIITKKKIPVNISRGRGRRLNTNYTKNEQIPDSSDGLDV